MVNRGGPSNRLKFGQLLDTLSERLALARSNRPPDHDFLEMLLADGSPAATAYPPLAVPKPPTGTPTT
jgi:hypothetical protein